MYPDLTNLKPEVKMLLACLNPNTVQIRANGGALTAKIGEAWAIHPHPNPSRVSPSRGRGQEPAYLNGVDPNPSRVSPSNSLRERGQEPAYLHGVAAETSPPDFDWHYFLQLSFSHRVFPLIAKKLEGAEFVPAAIQEKLQSSYRANLIKNLILTKTLLDLLSEFEQNNIPVLAFKGAALSQLIYEDVALRHFSDLDILVAETDLPAVRQLLLGQNYQPKLPLTAHLQTKYQKMRYEQDFWQADQNIALDLHWLLLPRGFSFSPSFAQIWQGRQALNLEGQTIQTLAKEAYLLYLCAHAAKSNWVDLSLVADIAALLHFNNLDWQWIKANTGKLATERMLLHGLNLAHHLLDAPLPAEYQAKIKSVNKTCAKIVERLVTPELNSLAVILKHNFFFESLVSPQDKIRYWYNELIVPTPLEWQAVNLAKILYPIYYLVRPVRLLYKSLTGRF